MINKQDWQQLIAQAQTQLTGASVAALKNELYDVMTEFLNDSSCWTEAVSFNAVADVTVYPVQASEGQIIRLAGVIDANATPQPAVMFDLGVVTLKHAPNTTQAFSAVVVKNIYLPLTKDEIPQGPDWLLPIWHVGLLDGILGKMFNTPQRSYSNETKAVYHLKRFRDATARARVAKLRANTMGAQSWAFPQSFRTRSQRGGVPSVGTGNERAF